MCFFLVPVFGLAAGIVGAVYVTAAVIYILGFRPQLISPGPVMGVSAVASESHVDYGFIGLIGLVGVVSVWAIVNSIVVLRREIRDDVRRCALADLEVRWR